MNANEPAVTRLVETLLCGFRRSLLFAALTESSVFGAFNMKHHGVYQLPTEFVSMACLQQL